jgi:hypothetical protein
MSIRAVVAWVIVLIVLAGATLVALRPRPARVVETEAPLLDLGAGVVDRVVTGNGARTFERGPDGIWTATMPGGTWFADGERVEAFVKVLARARGSVVDAVLERPARRVELAAGSSHWAIGFDDRELAGAVLARVESGGATRVMRVAGNLPGLLSDASVATWVSRAVFPLGVSDAQELRITRAEYSVTLKRTGQRWAIVAPAALPADQEEVGRLITGLGKLAYREFMPEMAEFRAAGLTVDVSAETRSIKGENVERNVRRQTLAGGAMEGPGSAMATAESRVSAGAERAARGLIEATLIEGISADPAAYASRVASTLARADVRRIMVKTARGERSCELGVEGWSMRSTGEGDAGEIRAAEVLDFLEHEKAARVVLASGFGGTGGGGDGEIGTITIGPARSGGVNAGAGQEIGVSLVRGDALAGLEAAGEKAVVLRTGGRTLVYTSPTALRQVAGLFGEEAGR